MANEKKHEPHVCEAIRECKYGLAWKNTDGCNYMTVKGKLRTSGGQHRIINGKCDLFEPKQKISRPGWIEFKEKEYALSKAIKESR